MNNLNWLGMWKFLKDCAVTCTFALMLLDAFRWVVRLFTHEPSPPLTLGKGILVVGLLFVLVVSGCAVALLSKKSHPSN